MFIIPFGSSFMQTTILNILGRFNHPPLPKYFFRSTQGQLFQLQIVLLLEWSHKRELKLSDWFGLGAVE